ncbi:MAG: RNA polymerase sigma-70 factor [Chitinophaga sp.]|uniref:RNA polymerase sigma-70 factor n=1 Tax=Chitinophaga sp. TaxID=1869181 RepID=UPI001B257C0C|nr:RNA polymerase sigma-70 factor [Chitinophaga sp.]MBO9730668.1 RNA polymerase sigma-70 factor [Chitinophaga sp.]
MALTSVHNEAILLAQVAGGDEKAFTTLFNAYHQPLGTFVMTLTESPEMTAEIVQDVFIKIWMNRQELSAVEKFTAYLFILTRNYTLNCLRKSANDRKKHLQYGQYVSTATSPVTEIPTADTDYFSLIDSAVAQLPPQQQQVYLLSRKEGLKHAEIAHQMGISKETVKKYVQLSVKAIAHFIKINAPLLAPVFLCFYHKL